MANIFRNSKKWLVYILYCLLVTTALLYCLFPRDILPRLIENALAGLNPQLRVSVEGADIFPPFGLRIHQARISLKGKSEADVLEIGQILLRPEIFPLIKGKIECSFHFVAYKGNIKGRIHLKKNSTNGPLEAVTDLKDVHIGEYRYLQDFLGRKISGTLSGKIKFSGIASDPAGGVADIRLKVRDGLVQLLEPIPFFEIDSVDFKKMQARMTLKNHEIRLSRLELDSSWFHGVFDGNVDLRNGLPGSILELKGKIRPSAAFMRTIADTPAIRNFLTRHLKRGRLSVVIFGSLKRPRIRFR